MPARAQAKPPGQTAAERVVEAHRQIETGTLNARFATYYSYPDETDFVTTSYSIVLDRPGKRVRVDRPGYTLISDGKDILLVAESLPGRHLRVPFDGALTYERLVEVFPDLANPTAPALVLLLSESPTAVLSDGKANDVTPLGEVQARGKAWARYGLPMQLGTCELTCDAVTKRLSQALIQLDPNLLGNTPVDDVRFHYEIQWIDINQPVNDELFQLDIARSHEMTTLAQFLSTGPGGGGATRGGAGPAGGGGAAAGAAQTLVGMPLPDMQLKQLGTQDQLNLSDLDEGVAVIEFYASWTKASTLDLPVLADFKAWCEENEHDVAVYGVAVGETAESMGKWIDALEKTAKREIELPILLDPENKGAVAMKLPTIPRTIIAVDGRVVDVFGGVKPNLRDDLKKGLPDWLKKVKPLEEGAERSQEKNAEPQSLGGD